MLLPSPVSSVFSNSTLSTVHPKRISAPLPTRYSLAFLSIRTSLSVPRWGFPVTKISGGAPNATSDLNTVRTSSLFLPMRVVSLPSDHVPAPPSP